MATVFLATVLGWYLVIFSFFMLFKYEYLKIIMSDLLLQKGLFFILAIMTFILGLLMVASHNVWVMDWPIIITLLSWLTLLSGLFRLFFPDLARRWGQSLISHPVGMQITSVFCLLVGGFLLFHVYFMYR